MYRRYAVKFYKKQVEFINCVNMVERIKRTRALPSGASKLGLMQCIVSSFNLGKKACVAVKDCASF